MYRTIVADPPWEYREGFGQGPTGDKRTIRVPLPYEAMTLEALAELPVAALAAPDAWLFVWTTNRYLPMTFDLIAGWGFAYTQTVTWRKTGDPSPFVSSVAPRHSEFLLAARRGRPARNGAFPSSVVDAPAQDQHSRKPECFLDYIEAIGDAPRLEMFSRRARFGWDTWGSEALHGTLGAPSVS